MNYVEYTMKRFPWAVLVSSLVFLAGIILFDAFESPITFTENISALAGIICLALPFAYWAQVAENLWRGMNGEE